MAQLNFSRPEFNKGHSKYKSQLGFKAKFRGTCLICKNTIEVGNQITLAGNKPVHVKCWDFA